MSATIVRAMQHDDAAGRALRSASESSHPSDTEFHLGVAQVQALRAIHATLGEIADQLKRLVAES